jgi:hypothetical protein
LGGLVDALIAGGGVGRKVQVEAGHDMMQANEVRGMQLNKRKIEYHNRN